MLRLRAIFVKSLYHTIVQSHNCIVLIGKDINMTLPSPTKAEVQILWQAAE